MSLHQYIPRFDVESAGAMAESLFGLRATACFLPSERDQNFLLTDLSGEKFVLKIANGFEGHAMLEAQNAALEHLESRISFCPRLVPATSGARISTVEAPCGSSHFVRLVRHIPGVLLASIRPHSPPLLRDFGRKLGQLDHALADFDHPALHRDFHWDLANGMQVLTEFGQLITDRTLQELVFKWRTEFENQLWLPAKLRRSVIHGDANDYNVLVEPRTRTIAGLIDFGDMVHSYTAGELAVALAYVVLDKPDPLGTAGQVVAGYATEMALTADELEALWMLVLLRLCMSVCLAAYQRRLRPENEYLDISQRSIRESLPALLAIDHRIAADTFRTVVSKEGRERETRC